MFLATTTVPYSSAPTTPSTKFESIKSWTISTYKCSRQTIYEKLGKSSRTVDSELETQIESLRETQRKYANILRLSRALTSHFYHVIQTQVNILLEYSIIYLPVYLYFIILISIITSNNY